jgi:tellurite resistance protein
MTESEAFAAIALATVACDGVLGKDEAHALRRHLEYRTPYKDRSESEMATLFDQLLKRLRETGSIQLIKEALPQLKQSQKETALAVAAQLVHADRTVTPEEESFLAELAQSVELPQGKAQAVMDAIMALNYDSLAS